MDLDAYREANPVIPETEAYLVVSLADSQIRQVHDAV